MVLLFCVCEWVFFVFVLGWGGGGGWNIETLPFNLSSSLNPLAWIGFCFPILYYLFQVTLDGFMFCPVDVVTYWIRRRRGERRVNLHDLRTAPDRQRTFNFTCTLWDSLGKFTLKCCFTSTETIMTTRDWHSTATPTFTQLVSSDYGARSVECCFTSTETVVVLGTGAQDGHLDFHTAPASFESPSMLLYVHGSEEAY